MSDRRKLLILAVGSLLARIPAAAFTPLLAAEAYYWLWNRYPAAGYYDHPPMTAFVTRLCFGWVPGVELAARSGALLMGALSILVVHGLASDLFGERRVALRAAMLFAVTPILAGLGMVLEPDNSLLLFTTLTWWMLWRALQRGGVRWWLLAGAAAGCALLSKFHAWVLLPPLLGYLVVSKRHRPLLRTAGPWLAVGVALLVLSPNLVWNARHDWLNYAFQWQRSSLGETGGATYVHFFVGGAVLALSPVLAWTMLRATFVGLRRARDDDRVLFLLCAGLPLPLFLGLLSLVVKISAHWPSCGYVPLLLLVVHLAESPATTGIRLSRWSWGGAMALTGLLYLLPAGLAVLPATPEAANEEHGQASLGRLAEETTGWREVAAAARAERDDLARTGPAIIFGKKWQVASMLAFYSGVPRECFALEAEYAHNFELWRAERGGLEGASAVVVVEERRPNRARRSLEHKHARDLRFLGPLFDEVEPLPSVVLYADGTSARVASATPERPRVREFLLYRCRGFRGRLHVDPED